MSHLSNYITQCVLISFWHMPESISLQVNGDTATWAIGYMLDASGKIASLEPKIALGTIAFAVGLALFLLVLAISLGACLFILLRK